MSAHAQASQLDGFVTSVWRRTQLIGFGQGALVFLGWAVALSIVGVLVDWLFSIPAVGRYIFASLLTIFSFYKAWKAGWRELRWYDPARTALQIETKQGGMESLLISAIQLRDDAGQSKSGLTALICKRAEEATGSLNPQELVRLASLRQPALVAFIALIALGGFAIADGQTLQVGAARLFAPWLDLQYPTRTKLNMLSGDLVVQEGKPVRISAKVGGVIPANAKIALRTGKGAPREHVLPIENDACEYKIATVFRDFDYRIIAGDARSRWHKVRVVYPPNIERAQVKLDYPQYTQRSPETVEALTITIPETTRIHWKLTLDRAVKDARVHLAGQDVLSTKISANGRTVSFEMVAADSRSYSFAWVEREHGYIFQSPSYYLQVAPDRAPRIELTSPNRDIYATLGRELNLAYRCRDDHGIAESSVVYRVGKLEERKASFTPPETADGNKQTVDWDYRTALPDLAEGDTVSFAIEAVDRYPGADGPHRARSESRRIHFVSEEEYLAYIEQQKTRLLSRLRTLYREQRQVYEVVLKLNPAAPVFVQSCQLEAVRQDLTGERLNKLAQRMHELADDLAANGITDSPLSKSLVGLRDDIRAIASGQVSSAAQALRKLASQNGRSEGKGSIAMTPAARYVDGAARDLGLLVLQLGYRDASEVMAREVHAAAQNQAALRLQTAMTSDPSPQLADAQLQLGAWLSRLFKASPSGSESTVDEALVEFTLTRMVKRLVNGGVGSKMEEAAALIREGQASENAVRLQGQVIAALLKAEFRLRVGAEREALAKAKALFVSQADLQKKLRSEIAGLDDAAFSSRRAELADLQADLQRNQQLLLMPEIPAWRARLFDDVLPAAPAVGDLLAAAEQAMSAARSALDRSDRSTALSEQSKAEQAFAVLVDIVNKRMERLTEAVRIQRMVYGAQEVDEKLELLGERQLGLLERTEDAAADEQPANFLAAQQKALGDAVEELQAQVTRGGLAVGRSGESNALRKRIGQAVRVMREAEALLAKNKPDDSALRQEAAVDALSASRELLSEHQGRLSAYASMLSSTQTSTAPSPFVGEIEQEQRDLLKITQKTKLDDLPTLTVAQKNLIHAVDAILTAFDPINHLVETGTVMLFAKEDMDSASVALTDKDPEEAVDAQQFIVETLKDLRGKIDAVVPQYHYLLEMVEALHETVEQGALIREAQRELAEKLKAKPAGAAALGAQQRALEKRMIEYADLIHQIAGPQHKQTAASPMAAAREQLAKAQGGEAGKHMLLAQKALTAESVDLVTLMQRLTLTLAAGEPGQEVSPEVALLRSVLSMAAQQKAVYRESCATKPLPFAELEKKLQAFLKQLEPFIASAKEHQLPEAKDGTAPPPRDFQVKLVEAKKHLVGAAKAAKAADRAGANALQKKAAESLRHFIADYALTFVSPPGGPSPGEPVPSTDFNETEDTMQLFMPGAVTGTRPPDGRLEWQVLGKRDRAALNENFARELPLEYRGILKNYYERLTQ